MCIGLEYGEYRRRNKEKDPNWFPWTDKITCILDILQHLPRSTFSDSQLAVITWALRNTGIPEVPSVYGMKTIQKMLDALCGVRTLKYEGSLGHIYYVNSLEDIVSQEMANPLVRPNLSFYPQEALGRVESAKNAFRWLHEMDASLTTPMVHIGNEDFYLFEPSRLKSGRYCIPYRWVEHRNAQGEVRLYGWVWFICPATGVNGWVVDSTDRAEVIESDFATSFLTLKESFLERAIPNPSIICGIYDQNRGFSPWKYTPDPSKGNPWREKAKGHPVYAFPIWLYCDDTSGNKSKKWNKHNSFLFTAAGLDPQEAHAQYHVHFLSTSNLAPPLEMLDGIVEQTESGGTEGIWAYDCLKQEMVLLIISVLALLGDNPMQSEFACHIGLMGKFFCRSCFVQGKGKDETLCTPSLPENDVESASLSSNSGSEASKNASKPETQREMIQRATRFFEIHNRRTRSSTIHGLKTIFTHSGTIGEKSKAKQLKTALGIKDTYQDHFTDLIFNLQKTLRGGESHKQEEVNKLLANLPKNICSPVWRIKGLDPHCDTPVEILHVILLGFLKYLWRDAMARLSDQQKNLLITRISSFNVNGLDIPSLNGTTLVKYAGSLVGRDFRIIAQIAVFVLYDLVPEECYTTWRALSTLVPLVWQPVIEDMDTYLQLLQTAIDNFLNCTANWTPRWFNKPKFHILLHLPEHIRRFGPAMLFATETFESYNAVIRGFSIHSNRQAPSRDIALEFAGLNRLRHMLSHGLFLDPRKNHSSNSALLSQSDFCSHPTKLIQDDEFLQKMLGFPQARISRHHIQLESGRTFNWESTLSSQYVDDLEYSTHTWRRCLSFHLSSGEICRLDSIVIFKTSSGTALGKVLEIIQSPNDNLNIRRHHPSLVLLQPFQLKAVSPIYLMPRISLLEKFYVISYGDLLCTVNTQHHCHGNNCHARKVQELQQQERTDITAMVDKFIHQNPTDIILNTAQMRDHNHIHPFTVPVTVPERSACISKGAEREINMTQNSKGKKTYQRTQTLLQRAIQGRSQLSGVAIQRESHLRHELYSNLDLEPL
ncbi:hypothetical protein DFJ43DRAFT_1001105 [Lentinula guzmanii]|uniref:Uncharacterized protein n=1 Tax=Lentinula guzmanii TaxID=2804957 RepID=A0AA38MZ93_9AGAR|nr:hypothetical protein DFJ43DRAFT_1125019 [Lentinula guzmanii]KAJ3729004.1 hypothetical protein DFJ43DRAFT_1001105 [Lentinula guzmanii]